MAAILHPRHSLHLDEQQQHQQPQQQPESDNVSIFETVDWSCCCCSRQTGVLVLGACFLGLSVGTVVLCAVEATNLRAGLLPIPTPPPSLLPMAPTSAPKTQPHPLAPLPDAVQKQTEFRRLQKGVLGLLTTQAVVAAAGALAAVVLLWGAWARRPKALLPWMVCAAAELVLLVAGGLYFISTSMSRKLPLLGLDGFFALVIMFLFCVPLLYCVLAVGTFYRELTGSKYSECKTSASEEAQPNGFAPSAALPPSPTGPPPVPAVPPPKRQAPRPPLQRLDSEGHENPAFQSTAF